MEEARHGCSAGVPGGTCLTRFTRLPRLTRFTGLRPGVPGGTRLTRFTTTAKSTNADGEGGGREQQLEESSDEMGGGEDEEEEEGEEARVKGDKIRAEMSRLVVDASLAQVVKLVVKPVVCVRILV
jgi:hypothetical protein